MAWSLIAQTGGYLGAPGGGTTSAINTTGAGLLLLTGPYFKDTGAVMSTANISDSKGNSWNQLTDYGSSGQAGARIFWSIPTSVGSGHTATISHPSNVYPSPTFSAFGGTPDAAPFDVENGFSGNVSSPQTTGSITPSVAGCLIVSMEAVGNATPGTVTPTMTVDVQPFGAFGYLVQGAAAAINPSWTWTGGSQGQALTVAAFKLAATGDIRLTHEYVEALTQNAAADVRVTHEYAEALTQNATADVRLTREYIEALMGAVDVRVTSEYVEALTQNPTADVRLTGEYVEVLGEPPPSPGQVTQSPVEILGVSPPSPAWVTQSPIETLRQSLAEFVFAQVTQAPVEIIYPFGCYTPIEPPTPPCPSGGEFPIDDAGAGGSCSTGTEGGILP